jgi:Protein of unknown function (DUF4038)/Domain of unknown function (DUF5060)/Putative collagen-binding domain of a collagenase
MKKNYLLVASFLFLLASFSFAQPKPVSLWGRWERTFTAAPNINPDPSIGLLVRLTAPSGKRHQVSAFWDGGRTWRVRFMPDEVGTWRFRTIAYPDYAGLNANTGSFICRKTKDTNPFLRHGALRVSNDGTHLEHADGTPFFWLGDTAWNGALLSKSEDWNTYLQDRVAKKFTAIQFVTTQWRSAPTNLEGEVAFTGKEKVQLNPAFFKRMDARIDALNAQGLLAVPVLLWAIKGDENPGWYLPEDQAILLEKYLVARYGAHHVVWIPAGDTTYREANGEKWRRISRAVFDGTKHAPVVQHPQGMQSYAEFFRAEKWLSFIGYQSGHGDNDATLNWLHSGPISKEWQLAPPRPFINLEPPYEDHVAYHSKQRHTAYTVRRACYWSLLNAPTAGVTYGAHGIWSWETTPKEPLLHQGTGIAKPWFDALKLPGSEQMKFMHELFASLRWWELRPAPDLLVGQATAPAHFIAAAKTLRGEAALVYLPVGGTVTLTAKAVKADWFDPRTGHWQAAAAGTQFQAPSAADWVLKLMF